MSRINVLDVFSLPSRKVVVIAGWPYVALCVDAQEGAFLLAKQEGAGFTGVVEVPQE